MHIGRDEDGEVISSCVVKETEVPQRGELVTKRRLGYWEKLVTDVVGEFSLGQNSGIEVDRVISEVVRRGKAPEEGKRDTRKQIARRALTSLCKGEEALYFMEDRCLAVLE